MITNSKIGYGGRLGNQMFQYAMLLGVANKTGYEVKLPINNARAVQENGCLDLFTGKWIPYKLVLDDCFDANITWMNDIERVESIKHTVTEKSFHFDESVFKVQDFTDFDGYYQSFKYFEHMMPFIRKTFRFKSVVQKHALSMIHWSTDNEVVSIHVRRGDYLGIPDRLPACEPEYFEKASNKTFATFEIIFIAVSNIDLKTLVTLFNLS